MITAVISARGSIEGLRATLSALVGGVVDGLVGDAVIVAPARSPEVERIADAMGASLVISAEDPWRRGAARARQDWILCLDAGDVPREGWQRSLERFIAHCPPDRRFGRFTRSPSGLGDRLSESGLSGLVAALVECAPGALCGTPIEVQDGAVTSRQGVVDGRTQQRRAIRARPRRDGRSAFPRSHGLQCAPVRCSPVALARTDHKFRRGRNNDP